jgi:hypothetical protein
MPDENGRRQTGHGGFSCPGDHPEEGSVCYWLSAIYPLQPGCRYTAISAINLTDPKKLALPPALPTGVVVAKPVEFSIPEGDFSPTPSGIFIGHDDRETPKPKPRPTPTSKPSTTATTTRPLTFDQQFEQAGRFAGKPFDGLVLEASLGKPAEIKIVLRNCAGKEILVTKWKGDSDYEVLIRGPAGKLVELTEKGRKFFQSGELLDIRTMKPKETIHSSLSLAQLFAIQAPGEYTVLVSLPVIGDVDAVLTATPVKLRVP